MATDFLSLLGAIPGLMSDFGGGTSAPYLDQQKQLAQQQQGISQALTQGPANPLYQHMYGQYEQQGANQLGQGVAELQAQNRANSALGRTPLLNSERGSENIFRNVMQGYQGLGTQADQQTRQALQGAMFGTNAAATDYNNLSKYGQAANSQQLTGYNTIYNLLRGLGGQQQPSVGSMGGGNYTQPQQNIGSTGAGNYTPQAPQQSMLETLLRGRPYQ